MIGIITGKTQELLGRRPRWPYVMNRDSWQAEGLVAWWPLGIAKEANDLVARKWDMANSGPTIAVNRDFGQYHAFARASSQYFEIQQAVVSAVPFSLVAWAWAVDITSEHGIICINDIASASNRHAFMLNFGGNVANDPVRALAADASAAAGADTTIPYAVNTIHHCVAVFTSATSRAAYIDGGNKGTNTTSRTPAGLDRTNIGRRVGSGGGAIFLDGGVIDARIYNRSLTDAEVFALWDAKSRWDLYYSLGRRTYSFKPGAAVTAKPWHYYAQQRVMAG